MAVLPKDDNASTIQLTPARVALEETYDATISSSTELTLNAATTIIRVCAIDKPILMKWGTSDVSTSDFDEIIPAGAICDFVVPKESGSTLYTAVNFIEQAATAILVVIEK